jgi:uncharacterized protein
VTLLSWILIVQVLLLICFGICYAAGSLAARLDLNDVLYRTFDVFWKVFLARRPAEYAIPDVVAQWRMERALAEAEASAAGELGDLSELPEGAEAPRPRAGKAAPPAEDAGEQVVILSVNFVPNAGRNEVLGRFGDAIKVQVTAAPEQGQANKALIDLLASKLGIKTFQIQLVRGHYRPVKTLRITGVAPDELDRKLEV